MTDLVAIHAPMGRDGRVIAQILGSAEITCELLGPAALVAGIADASLEAALLTEEGLADLNRAGVERALHDQPPWSDFPMVVLTGKGPLSAEIASLMQALGHVTQIERPVHAATLVRVVRAALRARARQRDAARYLAERAIAERDLRALTNVLEQRVVERTKALVETNDRLFAEILERIEAQDRMNEMQTQLIQVSRVSAMGTMASTLAHELNQPLTAVMNYTRGGRRLLQAHESQVPPEVLHAIDAAAESAYHAGEIVRHLRDLVRGTDVERSCVELATLVDDALALGMIDARALGVELRVALDREAALVLVDRIQIQQVLINLVRNAVEALDGAERREVVVSSRRVDDNMAEVSVEDSGPGLPPALLDGLFAPFRSTKTQGMGIGLSISRTIIEANGGSITGGNRPEGGARFCFTLPLSPPPSAADRIPASGRSRGPRPAASRVRVRRAP